MQCACIHMYIRVCHMSGDTCEGQRRVKDFSEAGVTAGCEPLTRGAGN